LFISREVRGALFKAKGKRQKAIVGKRKKGKVDKKQLGCDFFRKLKPPNSQLLPIASCLLPFAYKRRNLSVTLTGLALLYLLNL
jgi:hypothetical protein